MLLYALYGGVFGAFDPIIPVAPKFNYIRGSDNRLSLYQVGPLLLIWFDFNSSLNQYPHSK